MADGSELTRAYAYGFKNLVFGSGTDYVTTQVDGLLGMAPVRDTDTERQGDHGVFPGILTYGKRIMAFDLTIVGQAGTDIENKLAVARRVFQLPRKRLSRNLEPFTFWRPGQPKKMCFVRCTNRDFSSDFQTARGMAKGSVELTAPSPLIYSTQLFSNQIAPTGGSGSRTITMNGDYADGAWPELRITGPVTTALIQNVADGGRTIRLSLSLGASDVAIVNVEREIVWVNGVRRSTAIRSDNQWWSLLPGSNQIFYTRQGGNDNTRLMITHRDVWQ